MKSTYPSLTRKLLILAALLAATLGTVSAEAGPGRYRFNQDNAPGWTLMTPTERIEFRNKMRSSTTYDECKATQTAHHTLMQARAAEKGVTLPGPRNNACEQMKARGFLK